MQVTPNSVRLVSSTSRDLIDEWFAPDSCSLTVATANATQVCSCIYPWLKVTASMRTEQKYLNRSILSQILRFSL